MIESSLQVDDGGAAWNGGARSGDRILAVDDVSVTHASHKELVERIKASPNPMSMILLASVRDVTPGLSIVALSRIVCDSLNPVLCSMLPLQQCHDALS